MKLCVKQSRWSGWSKEVTQAEKEELYDIKLNEKYIIKTVKFSCNIDGKLIEKEQEIFSFEIIEINSD